MTQRPLTVFSAHAGVLAAAHKAAALAGDAVGPIREVPSEAELGAVEGFLIVDPSALEQADIYEWASDFLRTSTALVYLLTRGNAEIADGLARFVGAQGSLGLPLQSEELAERLRSPFGRSFSNPNEAPPATDIPLDLGEHLGEILEGPTSLSVREQFLRSVTDAETQLYTAPFWEHRLDEEFKRANRFRYPLSLVRFSFEGELDPDDLPEVSGRILLGTRDVDIVSRYRANVFLALLPHTHPAGAKRFSERVLEDLQHLELKDMLGDKLEWDTPGVASCPDQGIPNPIKLLDRVLPSPNGLPA